MLETITSLNSFAEEVDITEVSPNLVIFAIDLTGKNLAKPNEFLCY